ncbi:hypothetical protein [Aliidiomarina celeris]|uniref:hypothetical protein n=1 Tax=Aliidiomarina celeris TaxID=2249428 RepID=UPI0013004ED5|nr:hypothetical protein [Aliidiomarina celeris]
MNSDVSRNYTIAGIGVGVTSAALGRLWAPAAAIGTALDAGIGVVALSHRSYAENDYDASVLSLLANYWPKCELPVTTEPNP